MAKNKKKNVSGLKKWNKIVSIIVKDYKKNNVAYDLKEVRSLASQVYADGFKDVAPSKLRVGKVKATTKKVLTKDEFIEVTAKQLRDNPSTSYWFLDEASFETWFCLGCWVQDFVNVYPNVPTMIVTSRNIKSPLVVQGAVGSYDGGIFQKWVENVRESLVNDENSEEWQYEDDQEDEIDTFMADAFYIKGQWYAVWFEKSLLDTIKADLEELPPEELEPIEIDERTQVIIEEKEIQIADDREKAKKKRKAKKKLEKIPKKSDKKPIQNKGKTKKEGVDGRSKEGREAKSKVALAEKINERITKLEKQIETIKEEVKDGFTTKTQGRKQVAQIRKDISEISKTKEKGGKI
tara:strand:+ start:31 stop:1080 length:1050 start_codon:yes stop_codon:yes gene_type:complete